MESPAAALAFLSRRFPSFICTQQWLSLATAVLFGVSGVVCANARTGPQLPENAAPQNDTQNQDAKKQSQAQKVQPVTTTVLVHADLNADYLPTTISVGSLSETPLKDTPLSVTVVTRDLMNNQISRLLPDVIKNNASIVDDYVPVGYYGDYQVRGFPLDLATGFQINGMTIAGEQDVPLENKERVELLNGLAGVESGVASAGGLINFVTKQPTTITAIDAATDQRGTAYGALDIGRLFGSRKQVGARINIAGERLEPYLQDTQGWRAVGAGSADWKINSKAVLRGDFEYQHKNERDGSGYQLLGGTALPDINQIARSTMLGEQPWGQPDTYDTFNTGARFDYSLSPKWSAFAAASLSHSLIDDNVIYAYGCYLEAECNTGSAPFPWFFAPDGTYDVYDYRDPGELRLDGETELLVAGIVKSGAITQNVAFGGELFLRSVRQPGFFTVDNPYSPDGIVQDGAVYTYVGSENIYQPLTAFPYGTPDSLEDPLQSAGPRRLWEDSHQTAGILQDRIQLPGRVQLLAAAKLDRLRDNNYSAYAGCADFFTGATPDPCAPKFNHSTSWLPQFAITYGPTSKLTLYSNYGVGLSLAPQAPFWTDNGSQFLDPFHTRQAEVGAKYELGGRMLISGDAFRMRAPFFYPKTLAGPDAFCPTGNPGDQCFESEGRETHDGIELNGEGKANSWLHLTASAALMRAESTDTGTPAFDGKQVLNVPHLHTTVFADIALPHMRGLFLMPGWSYTGRKEATRDDTLSVPSYNVFDLGARYTLGGEQGRVTFRLYADNIANKHYWSDTGASYGDTFIWLGAPTTVRLAAHYRF
jgi:iron complex outermembrane receptor protein